MPLQEETEFEGWILDASTTEGGMILWVKREKTQDILQIFDEYHPEFFAVPCSPLEDDLKYLHSLLKDHPNITAVRICQKYVTLDDHEKTPTFGISVVSPSVFHKVINEVNELALFTLYNTDLPVTQMYFYRHDLFPFSFCHFKISFTERHKLPQLVQLDIRDDNEKLFYELPPLNAIWLEIKVQQRDIKPYFNEPLAYATISIIENDKNWNVPRADGAIKEKRIVIDKADEVENLIQICQIIEKIDPDIILTQGGDEFIFPYLAARASIHGISSEFFFSRTKTPLKYSIFELSGDSDHYMSYGIIRKRSKTQVYFTGRFHLDTTTYGSLHFSEGNIPGVIEVARISRVPLQRLCRITIGGALQSIQFYNAYKLDHLIPPFKKNPENFSTGMDLIKGDRGGHIFEPKMGIFEQVVELDFSSMYPSLMANYNISSETINCECCKDDGTGTKVPGLDFHICSKREGIISKSIRLPLEKRLKCKAYVRRTNNLRYKFTDIALKWILVVSFGYLGFRNARFGKIEAHQTVCAFAREFLMRAAEISKKYGCRIIHGIVDSLWLQDTKKYSLQEFKNITKSIAKEITEETKIPMSWDGIFNIIIFLPSQAHPDIPTLNHYWGIKSDGSIKVRGIELRRRDTPKIIKQAQKEVINIFRGVHTISEFKEKIPHAKDLLVQYAKKIKSGVLSKEDLTIHQKISRKPSQYKVNSYQAVAAKQAETLGIIMTPGTSVRYIILNANANPDVPQKKVILSHLYKKKIHQYDKKKYTELLKRAFENLFPFELIDLNKLLNNITNEDTIQKDLKSFF
ncbi:MAG: putative DNA polymerase (Inactivated B2-family) [Promethearchaeota archaeon]|nr:MAG: putative DNA polymerase (Inactivated B2-family) [Candidatus Lokiarchaeota archaeon]